MHRASSTHESSSHDHGVYAGPPRGVFTVGIGGPVGSGKTALTLVLARALWPEINLAVITNDIYTKEDAEFLIRHEATLGGLPGQPRGRSRRTALAREIQSGTGLARRERARLWWRSRLGGNSRSDSK